MRIQTEKNQKEIKEHGSFSFPVNVSEESIAGYIGSSFPWHWHPEIELSLIMSGQIAYFVNDQQYLLKSGDGLFGNSNTLHSGHMSEGNECRYLSVTFHPRFIYGHENSILQTKYVDFIITNTQWSSLMLTPTVPWQNEIIQFLQSIHQLSTSMQDDYEIALHLLITQIWQKLYQHYCTLPQYDLHTDNSLTRLKTILAYIQLHYPEPMSLEDIAGQVNICQSECCRFFKKHMNMTLFEYVMFYRVEQSIILLKNGESITNAASLSGFSDSSYYGKIFKRYMKCSPGKYKKMRNTK